MLFSSAPFLTLFLPVVLLLYYAFPLKNVVLLTLSLIFYAWGEPVLVSLLIATIFFNYLVGLWMGNARDPSREKLVLAFGITVNVGTLIIFKYLTFLVTSLNGALGSYGIAPLPVPHVTLPLGVSFFTFQAISYLIDIRRRHVQVERSLLRLAVFKAFFPQLIAGPIVRYGEIAQELGRRHETWGLFALGVERFVIGLAKKVLIADTLSVPVDAIWQMNPAMLDSPTAWFGILCFTLQIYYDFSGYTDMAIGLAMMFGFHFPENFNKPYSAVSIQDFWRRWHMTLSRWFRDYLYIPLGGSRAGRVRTYLNLFLVFGLCGLWHGANWTFLVWGLWHGLFLVIERTPFGGLLGRSPRLLRHGYVLVVVMVGWVFFRAPTLEHALYYLKAMFAGPLELVDLRLLSYTSPYVLLMLAAGVLAAFPWPRLPLWRVGSSGEVVAEPGWVAAARLGFLTAVLLACFSAMASNTLQAFIYFRF